ncbi:MAG TPA: nucleotide exchange factor GrpE [Methylomirabilota bacterium]|nr:nucleotide exchange factor GrpE [Methylomirabilota bacterium]
MTDSKAQTKKASHETDAQDEAKGPSDETILQLQSQLKELDKVRQENERKAAEYLDKLQRLQADMENLQKITKRQIETVTSQATRDLSLKLLPILDALRQAGDFARGHESVPPEEIAVGLDMLHRQLVGVLKEVGVEEITAVGQPLDPERHEVVNSIERNDAPENTVVEEVRKGYQLNGKVLRTALVVVAKPKPPTDDTKKTAEESP